MAGSAIRKQLLEDFDDLTAEQQQRVWEFARGLRRHPPQGASAEELMSLAGTLDTATAIEMRAAIEDEFERIGTGD